MNKTFKIIWSKARNCYVVASELAKRHTKSSKSGVFSKTLVAGVLVCLLSLGFIYPVKAATRVSSYPYSYYNNDFFTVPSGNNSAYIIDRVFIDNSELFDLMASTVGWSDMPYDSEGGLDFGSFRIFTDANGVSTLYGTVAYNRINGYDESSGNAIYATEKRYVQITDVDLQNLNLKLTDLVSGANEAELRPSDNGNYEEYFSILL